MIFHLSIDADDPAKTAAALAEIWGCESYPFPAVGQGSWMVLADDGRGSAIEVYQRGMVLEPGEGRDEVKARLGGPTRSSATHFAVATPCTEARVHEIAEANGWRSGTHWRGGMFRVIEVWIENRLMVEVLTAEMQEEYRLAVTPAGWRVALQRGPRKAA